MNRFFVPITSNDYLIAIELLWFPMEKYKTLKSHNQIKMI